MSKPWSSVRVLIGWGLAVGVSGVAVSDGLLVDVEEGWVIGVVEGRGLGVVACAWDVPGLVANIASPGRLSCGNRRPIPYAKPPSMIRLINTSKISPPGVMRSVHPTPARRLRGGRDRPFCPSWPAIIGIYAYFTRCKKCAQVEVRLLFEPGAIELELHSSLRQQLIDDLTEDLRAVQAEGGQNQQQGQWGCHLAPNELLFLWLEISAFRLVGVAG